MDWASVAGIVLGTLGAAAFAAWRTKRMFARKLAEAGTFMGSELKRVAAELDSERQRFLR